MEKQEGRKEEEEAKKREEAQKYDKQDMPIYASEEEKNENTNKRKADTKGKRSMWSKVCLPRLLIVTAFSLSVATALHLSICVENIRLLYLQGISSAWARIWAGLRYGVELWGEGGQGGARKASKTTGFRRGTLAMRSFHMQMG